MKLIIDYKDGKRRFILVSEVEVQDTSKGNSISFSYYLQDNWFSLVFGNIEKVTLDGEVLYENSNEGEFK